MRKAVIAKVAKLPQRLKNPARRIALMAPTAV
jgi:hypothetical protein